VSVATHILQVEIPLALLTADDQQDVVARAIKLALDATHGVVGDAVVDDVQVSIREADVGSS
jgi:hypothetical protein